MLEIESKVRGYQVRTDAVYYYLKKSEESNYALQVGDYIIRQNSEQLLLFLGIIQSMGTIGKYRDRLLFADTKFAPIIKILTKVSNIFNDFTEFF